MKKIFLILMISIVTMAQGAMAQSNSIIIFDIDPATSVTENSIRVSGQRIAGNDTYHVVLEYREQGQQNWNRTDTNTFGPNFNAVFTKIVTGLSAETNYELRFKAYNTLFTDSSVSTVKTATTLPVPTPPTITITNVVAGLPNSLVVFNYQAVQYDATVTAYNALNGQVIGVPMMVAPGTSTDTFLVPNVSGQTHVLFLVIDPVINGLPIAQSGTITITAPSLVKPELGLWTVDYRGVDSLKASISITSPGNGGAITTRSSIKEENGTWVHNFADTNADSVVIGIGNLLPNTYYRFTATTESSAGSVTASVLVNTSEIPGPTGTVSNTQKTKNTTSFVVNVNPNGSHLGSTVSEVGIVENGDTTVYQTFFQTAGTLSVNKTGKIPATTYTYKGWVKNDAGLIATFPQFSLTTDPPAQAIAPQWGTTMAQNPSRIDLLNIFHNVTPGDNATLFFLRRTANQSGWDTIMGPQSSLSGSYDMTDNGLLGGTEYFYRIGSISEDGHIAVNSQQRNEITPAAQRPDVFEIIINSINEYSFSFAIPGNGNGTMTTLKVELYELSTGFLIESQTISVGTGDFNHQGNFNGLTPGTDYELKAIYSGPSNSNPEVISKFFKTLGTTGIDDRFSNNYEDVEYVAYDIKGREIGRGTKRMLSQQHPMQEMILFIAPSDGEKMKKYGMKMMSLR